MNEKIVNALGKYKYAILIFLFGILLMLMPPLELSDSSEETSPEEKIRYILSRCDGVGETCVIISEHGVVICCEGADKASVRLDIINALRTYTGFSGDRITILKLEN